MKTAETKSIVASGNELDAILKQHLADGWRIVGQSTLGASEFEIVLSRDNEEGEA